MRRAAISLPVPLSPSINTVTSLLRHFLDQARHSAHALALANERGGRGAFLQARAQFVVFHHHRLVFERLLHQHAQALRSMGLGR